MFISRPELALSPEHEGVVRMTAHVRYLSRLTRPESIWFEFDQALADQVSLTGNAWLVALLPLAMVRGEPLEIEAPVDPFLLEHVRRLQLIWSRWFPRFSPIPVTAEAWLDDVHPTMKAAFFSGGVDSFYTVLHARERDPEPIEALIFVRGADILIENQTAFERARDNALSAAGALGLPLITVATNLRSSRFQQVNWDYIGTGPLLGAVGLSLERRFNRILISSTWSGEALHPLGTHPETDPLFSTRSTKFIHYGDWADRIAKTEYISHSPLALKHLRVCWESPVGNNCGHCLKCLRTMAALEVMGKLDACPNFAVNRLDLELISRQYLSREWRYYHHLIPYACSKGREDVAGAIQKAVERTAWLDRYLMLGVLGRVRSALNNSARARVWLGPVYAALRRTATRAYFAFGSRH